jgi:hypothetical protein
LNAFSVLSAYRTTVTPDSAGVGNTAIDAEYPHKLFGVLRHTEVRPHAVLIIIFTAKSRTRWRRRNYCHLILFLITFSSLADDKIKGRRGDPIQGRGPCGPLSRSSTAVNLISISLDLLSSSQTENHDVLSGPLLSFFLQVVRCSEEVRSIAFSCGSFFLTPR